jgi:CelD/BcsL family acetyltransferase involved in cellulose biosynthesis
MYALDAASRRAPYDPASLVNARDEESAARGCPALTIDVARTVDAFAALAREWDQLYAEAGSVNPFLSYAWTRACFDEENSATEPFVLTLRRGDALIGLAPLCVERKFGFRILRFIAEGRSDYLGFLCDSNSEAIERRLLAEVLTFKSEWDLIVLRNLAEPFTSLTTAERPKAAEWHRVQWTTSAYCRWEGDWDSLQEGGPVWLKQMRNRRRRFLKNGRTIEFFTGARAAERLDLVAGVEAKSWKGRQGAARFQPGPGQEILRRAFLAPGSQMRLALAFVEERPIAFQVDFVTPHSLWMYQYSYDAEFANLRAGSVLQYASIDQAWQLGVREYDLLMGEESYKANRTTALRPISCLAGRRRSIRSWLAYLLLVGVRWKLRQLPAAKRLYEASKQFFRKQSA